MSAPPESPPPSAWAVAANVVAERRFGPLGLERRRGTKHFLPGAKVFVIDAFGGMCESVVVVGHHRGSHRWVRMILPVSTLERFRPALAYNPRALALIAEQRLGPASGHAPTTREEAAEYAAVYARWKEACRGEPLREAMRVVEHRAGGLTYLVSPRDPVGLNLLVPTAHLPPGLQHVGAEVLLCRDEQGEVAFEPSAPAAASVGDAAVREPDEPS